MGEGLHILLREARECPTLDPRPRADVCNAILPLSVAREVLTWLPRVLAAQLNLQHAIHAQGLVLESLDGVGDLLLGILGEVVDLALIRSAGPVPEEKPLELYPPKSSLATGCSDKGIKNGRQVGGTHSLTPLKLILKPEGVVAIVLLEEIEQLGRGLHDGERRLLGVVEDDGDAAVWIEAEEPVLLLFVGHDVAACFQLLIAWRVR